MASLSKPRTYVMNSGLSVSLYTLIVRAAIYFYFILQKWLPFANSAVLTAQCHGNCLKPRQHAVLSFLYYPTLRRNTPCTVATLHADISDMFIYSYLRFCSVAILLFTCTLTELLSMLHNYLFTCGDLEHLMIPRMW